jgi:hypothetical protein
MPDISRLYVHAEGDFIEAHEINEEFDQLIGAVNARVEADTTLWADLYAERLHDGTTSYPVGAAGGSGKVPVCNSTTIQVGLNADLLDGSHLSDILDAGFDTGTAMLFYQALAPGGWTIVPAPSLARHFGWKTSKSGGTTEGGETWASSLIASAAITVFPHTLTLSEVPPHTHTFSSGVNFLGRVTSGVATLPQGTGSNTYADQTTTSTTGSGGGGSHTHTATLGISAGWQPPVAWVIVCSKN